MDSYYADNIQTVISWRQLKVATKHKQPPLA